MFDPIPSFCSLFDQGEPVCTIPFSKLTASLSGSSLRFFVILIFTRSTITTTSRGVSTLRLSLSICSNLHEHHSDLTTRGEREFPFPTIFGNTGLRFPFPKFGNEFFIPVPVPKSWECFFDSRSRSQNLGMQFSIPVPVNGNGLSRRE